MNYLGLQCKAEGCDSYIRISNISPGAQLGGGKPLTPDTPIGLHTCAACGTEEGYVAGDYVHRSDQQDLRDRFDLRVTSRQGIPTVQAALTYLASTVPSELFRAEESNLRAYVEAKIQAMQPAVPCKHVHVRDLQLPTLSGSIAHREINCRLKESSEQNRLTVYDALFQKGLAGSIVGNDCPVAQVGAWRQCPFYEPST